MVYGSSLAIYLPIKKGDQRLYTFMIGRLDVSFVSMAGRYHWFLVGNCRCFRCGPGIYARGFFDSRDYIHATRHFVLPSQSLLMHSTGLALLFPCV
jgi:hypothetical protein